VVFIKDLLQVLTILISVINGDRDAFGAESACAPNSVQVVLAVTNFSVASRASPLRRHIVIYHDLNLRHIDTSCQHVRGYDDADLSRPKFFNHLISLFVGHVTENDCRLQVLTTHHLMQTVSVRLSVDEYDSLGHLTDIEDVLDEIRLLSRLATILILLDVIQSEDFLLQVDLMSCTRER